ncbi:MAG TPA: N-acetylneuraminate synthase [Burkholderiales bacterium]|nr:N-acetylneuraminate synthase [Burkholderiales bacterium]
MNPRLRIIAEAGVNHNGSLDMAMDLVRAAARAGADAVKFQTFKAGLLATAAAPKAAYQLRTTPEEESQLQMLARLELNEDAHKALSAFAGEMGIEFMSSAFDVASQDMLVRGCGIKTLKIPSGELTNAVLLLDAGGRGLPILMSTGMATLAEIRFALGVLAFGLLRGSDQACRAAFERAFESAEGKRSLGKVTLLHCVSAYPAPASETNLLAMDTLRGEFGLPVGFSDHSTGTHLPIAAAARGAAVIEKHLTLDRSLPGPDHAASLEPAEFTSMVRWIRETVSALGDGRKVRQPSEENTAQAARRSLVAVAPIRRGEQFTAENLSTARPGTGISAAQYWDWLGRTAQRDFDAGEVIG